MKYNVFVDFHHASLLQSLILLFEGRFGGNVYRPIGREWFDRGYWNVHDHPATVEQYLGIGGATPDGSAPLNEVETLGGINDPSDPGLEYHVYNCHDIDSDKTNKAIMLDRFFKIKIDIVIASLPQHVKPFHRLCQLHVNKPKLIYQIGNEWNIGSDLIAIDGIMASAKIHNPFDLKNWIVYHQEFDTDVFHYEEPYDSNMISSFVNCFDVDGMFQHDWELFKRIEQQMPEWFFSAFGGQCRDGSRNGSKELAKAMHESRFIWHTKNGGDGYGHIVYNSAATGRPLITRLSHYRGKLGEEVMIDGETCIAIDGLSDEEIINKIQYYNKTFHYTKMNLAIQKNFKQKVDFKKEADKIAQFLENLL